MKAKKFGEFVQTSWDFEPGWQRAQEYPSSKNFDTELFQALGSVPK